jgi:hypothetical protein
LSHFDHIGFSKAAPFWLVSVQQSCQLNNSPASPN